MNNPWRLARSSISSLIVFVVFSGSINLPVFFFFSTFLIYDRVLEMKRSKGSTGTGILLLGSICNILNWYGWELFYPTGRIWNQPRPCTSSIICVNVFHSICESGFSLSISRHYNLASFSSSFWPSFPYLAFPLPKDSSSGLEELSILLRSE